MNSEPGDTQSFSLHSRDTGQPATGHCSNPLVPGSLRDWEGGVLGYMQMAGKAAAYGSIIIFQQLVHFHRYVSAELLL